MSDRWDPLAYQQPYDASRSFFEQFGELLRRVPRAALSNNNSENSPYCNFGDRNSNCYLATSCNDNQDCYYGFWMLNNSDCADIAYSLENRLCYELIDCVNCNQVRFSQDSRNCNESWFLYDCVNCSNCFGCTNLRMKEYHLFNKPYSPEEYQRRVQELTVNRSALIKAHEQFAELKKKAIQRYTKGFNNVDVTGGGIKNSQSAKYCFEVFEVVDSAYVFDGVRTKDSYDLSFFDECELLYECHSVMGYNMQFTNMCRTSPETQYSDSCHNGNNLFGCVGLRHKSFHILNTPYSEAEYKILRAQIIADMTRRGEYGEFFPVQLSPFAYNETLALDYFPLKQSEVEQRGWLWLPPVKASSQAKVAAVPDQLAGVADTDIHQAVFACEICDRRFKVISQEVSLYRSLGVQLPKRCFVCRQLDRERLRNPWKLFKRQCMCTQTDHEHHGRCAVEFETNYSPDNTAIIYCDNCYQKEVY